MSSERPELGVYYSPQPKMWIDGPGKRHEQEQDFGEKKAGIRVRSHCAVRIIHRSRRSANKPKSVRNVERRQRNETRRKNIATIEKRQHTTEEEKQNNNGGGNRVDHEKGTRVHAGNGFNPIRNWGRVDVEQKKEGKRMKQDSHEEKYSTKTDQNTWEA